MQETRDWQNRGWREVAVLCKVVGSIPGLKEYNYSFGNDVCLRAEEKGSCSVGPVCYTISLGNETDQTRV